jgi:ribosome-binding factor A
MAKRKIRVDELLKREVSEFLHTRYRSEAVYITIVGVDVSPDLRVGTVRYSVLGDDKRKLEAEGFLRRVQDEIARALPRRVILKYFPRLTYHYDDSLEEGHRVLELLEHLDEESEPIE